MVSGNFDVKGFIFFVRLLAFVFIFVVAGHYGSRYAVNIFYATEYNTSHIEQRIGEIRFDRLKRIADQNRILDPRVTRTIGVGDYIPIEGKFIAVNLDSMKLDLYEDGEIVGELDVLSKGREGSYWETPSGLYKIMAKEESHYSSIGGVYMPYSMQFFGNFFIHGWPYYPGNTPVASSYSGGCVRLSTEDAKTVYEFVDNGTKVFVYDGEPARGFAIATKIRNIPKPLISARAVLVADMNTGSIYYEQNPDQDLPIASLTKLMTAAVANETISFDKLVTVQNYSESEGDDSGTIKSGDSFFVGELIYPLLMESNNDVAHSLSAYYGDKEFISWMNTKAEALGMVATKFHDPSGLSEFNVSTASDLFRLVQYLYNKQSFVFEASREKTKRMISSSGREYLFHNFNTFVEQGNFVAGKTGFTNAAHQTMASVFDVPVEDSTSTIAVIILASENREQDTADLLQWFSVAAVPVDKEPSLFSRSVWKYIGAEAGKGARDSLASVFGGFSPFIK
ncbi:MAG: L,D-transpeptidase family protein [bacterium]|nr:L,D-transpeptidase family protein [bacterium]